MIANNDIPKYLMDLERMANNTLNQDINFINFCEQSGRLNANALTHLCNKNLYHDVDNRTPIFYIAGKGTKEEAEQLIAAGAAINITDRWFYTPLFLACLNDNHAVAQVLIKAGAHVNHRDKENDATSLHIAAQQGFSDLFSLLITHGAIKDAVDKRGITPLYLAILAGKYQAARILIDQFKCNIDYEVNGITALQDACSKYSAHMMSSNISEATIILDQIQFMIEMGANVNREFNVSSGSLTGKLNYILLIIARRIPSNNLHELDYKLTKMFAKAGFNFNGILALNIQTMRDYILLTRNLKLIKSCQIISEDVQTLVETPLSTGDDLGAITFYEDVLSETEKLAYAKQLKYILDNLLPILFAELNQIFRESLDVGDNVSHSHLEKATSSETQSTNDEKIISAQIDRLSSSIIDLLKEFYDKIAKYGLQQIPKWCSEITIDKLKLKSIETLENLKSKVQRWGEYTLLQLNSASTKNDNLNHEAEIGLKPPQQKIIFSAIYESSFKFTSSLITDVSEFCGVLMPFNWKGEIGLNVITDAKNISPADRDKFERVLKNPHISQNPNQPGIQFLPEETFECDVIINQIRVRRGIIAELKIADSPHRIALYRLNQEGRGMMVLACAAYVENGFHDFRYKGRVFQAPQLDLTDEFITQLLKRLTYQENHPSHLTTAATLPFFKSNTVTTATDDEVQSEKTPVQASRKYRPKDN